MSDESLQWLYAVARDSVPVEVAGIGDAPVRAVHGAGLCAFVSTAPAGLSEAGALQERLEDAEWVARTAVEHHRVVAALASAAPVVPAGLATVCRGEARITATLVRHAAGLTGALDRVTGRTEWGVKGYVRGGPAPVPETKSGGAGTAYLERRRAQLSARDRRHDEAARDADAAHAELARRADAAHRHAPQDRRLTGEPEAMVLNGAYLVPDERAVAFAAAVDDLAARYPTITLRLTGPWPPYSFVPALGAEPSDPDRVPGDTPVPAGGPP